VATSSYEGRRSAPSRVVFCGRPPLRRPAVDRRAAKLRNVFPVRELNGAKGLNLADALDLMLLVGELEPEKYARVALRWHGRYCSEREPTLAQAQAVLALLVLADPASASTLRELVRR
jgi:hypothetical protein